MLKPEHVAAFAADKALAMEDKAQKIGKECVGEKARKGGIKYTPLLIRKLRRALRTCAPPSRRDEITEMWLVKIHEMRLDSRAYARSTI